MKRAFLWFTRIIIGIGLLATVGGHIYYYLITFLLV